MELDSKNDLTKEVDPEDKELMAALISRALKGEHFQTEKLKTLGELKAANLYYNAAFTISKTFNSIANREYKKFLKSINTEIEQIDSLLFYKKFYECAVFYKEEYLATEKMINEYIHYIHRGHLIDTLLGIPRN